MPTAAKKKPKKVARKNRYGLSPEYIRAIEREFRRILPRAGTDKDQADLLRIARRGFGLGN